MTKTRPEVCPKDGGKWKYYHGMLGYESLICDKCGIDIADMMDEMEGKNMENKTEVKASYTPGYFTLFDLSEENDPEQKRPFREWSLVHGGPAVYLHTEWGEDGVKYAKIMECSPELLETLKTVMAIIEDASICHDIFRKNLKLKIKDLIRKIEGHKEDNYFGSNESLGL